jgi:hypothetical protein
MAWRRYKHSDSKREIYDRIVMASACYPVYLLSWYLDIVCKDWEFLLDEERSLVIPLPVKRKFGFRYAIQPLWVQQMGCIGALENFSDEPFRLLPWHKLLFLFFRVKGGQFARDLVMTHRNAVLDLAREYEQIRFGYHEQIVRHLKKAERKRLKIVLSDDPERVFRLFIESKAESVRVSKQALREQFLSIGKATSIHNMSEVWTALDDNGTVVAGAFLLVGRERIILLLSGAGKSGRECGAMTAILDAAIRKHAGRKVVFDFEGSDFEGLFRYYMGFGASEQAYGSIYQSSLPTIFSDLIRMRLKNRIS